jgi:hypothetical protein
MTETNVVLRLLKLRPFLSDCHTVEIIDEDLKNLLESFNLHSLIPTCDFGSDSLQLSGILKVDKKGNLQPFLDTQNESSNRFVY